MSLKRVPIIPAEQSQRIVRRMAHEILERNRSADNLVVLGIKQKGEIVATRLAERISAISGTTVRIEGLDIGPFRDDAETAGGERPVASTSGPDVTDRDVVLVDDVLFTGRSVRAALDAVVGLGRPRTIQLAVLIDRGHREYPVRPDYLGRKIPTKHRERVVVDTEGDLGVFVEE